MQLQLQAKKPTHATLVRQLLPQFTPGKLAPRRDAWVLRILTPPPGNRLTRILIVAAYIISLGIVDCLSGTTLSLQVFYLAPIALALAWLGFFAAFIASVCSIIARVGGDYLLGAEYTRRPSIVWNTLGFLAT